MLATLTGLEPATSAVTGRRANQLRYRALLLMVLCYRKAAEDVRAPNGIRTRVATLKGWSPGPLDDGDCLAVGDVGEHTGPGTWPPYAAVEGR